MWARLAQREDLPDAAFAAVVDGLLPGDGRFEPGWQEDVFKETLLSMFRRVEEQGLRDRLIAAASSRVPRLVRRGVLCLRDVPAVLRHHPADGELLAALAQHVVHREVITGLIENSTWNIFSGLFCLRSVPTTTILSRLPEVPEWLLEAVVRRGLSLVAAELNSFAAVNGQASSQGRYWGPSGWPAYGSVAMVLERCPQWWLELAKDDACGQSVQHVLLDCVDTEKNTDEVLAACMPALVLPEWAELPAPERTQRERLRHIGQRVTRHLRLQDMAAAHLHDAAAHCIKQVRLLHATKLRRLPPYEVTSLARDLALTSDDAKNLKKLWAMVAEPPSPQPWNAPPSTTGINPLHRNCS